MIIASCAARTQGRVQGKSQLTQRKRGAQKAQRAEDGCRPRPSESPQMYRTLPLGSSVHDLTPLVVTAGGTRTIGHGYLSTVWAGQSGRRGERSQPLRLSLRRTGMGGLSLGCCHFHFLLMNKLHKSMNKLHKTLSQGASSVIRGLAPRISNPVELTGNCGGPPDGGRPPTGNTRIFPH